jgi:DNA-directed RNA polymerase subunit RPC12/RpoP
MSDSHERPVPHPPSYLETLLCHERPINMYCRSCGKEVSLHAAFCRHCGSKVAIRQAVPLPTKAEPKMRKILALFVLGVVCLAALLYGLSGNTGQRQSEASLPVSSPTATPSESPTLGEAATKSAPASGSAQLNSAASPVTAPIAETAAPVRSIAPKPKQVEETFYITRTGERYHRGSCHHLRRSAIPITRAEAEARGYTPCWVCHP